MTGNRHTEEVRAVDMEVGGDDDLPGIALELTTDDIDDIGFDPNLSVGERRERLMELRDELSTRRFGDRFEESDMDGLASHLRDRLAALRNPQESETVLESTGMYPEDRSDDDDPADHVDDEEPEEDGGP
jgi:hypothetical protein